jgi:hypothetical protein
MAGVAAADPPHPWRILRAAGDPNAFPTRERTYTPGTRVAFRDPPVRHDSSRMCFNPQFQIRRMDGHPRSMQWRERRASGGVFLLSVNWRVARRGKVRAETWGKTGPASGCTQDDGSLRESLDHPLGPRKRINCELGPSAFYRRGEHAA